MLRTNYIEHQWDVKYITWHIVPSVLDRAGTIEHVTYSLVAETKDWTPLIPKPAMGTVLAFSIHFPPLQPIFLISILMFWSGIYPAGFLTKNLHAFLDSPIWATWSGHYNLFGFIVLTMPGDLYRSLTSLLYNILNFTHTSFFLLPHVFPEHLVFRHL